MRVVTTLAEGLALLLSQVFHGCLLDLNLPDSMGIATLRRLRERWRGPVVVLSAIPDDQLEIKSLRLGAGAFFAKQDLTDVKGQEQFMRQLKEEFQQVKDVTGIIHHISEQISARVSRLPN